MEKRAKFAGYKGYGWPDLQYLEPYFLAEPGKEWFYSGGNDSAGFSALGVDGTSQLEEGKGRIDVNLSLWGNPELGILLIYQKHGGGLNELYSSRGDLSRMKGWVRTLHDDVMPVGLFIPFAVAWEAVKEFIETNGNLPNSIEWVKNSDLPANSFPDPSVVLPGEETSSGK